MAAEADTKKDALVAEVRAAAAEQRAKVEKERLELAAEKELCEKERREVREQGLQLAKRAEEAEYARREVAGKLEAATKRLEDKLKECEQREKEGVEMRRQIGAMMLEMGELRDTAHSVENLLRKEVDEMRGEIEDMGEVIKVKDRMLDDQNVTIA